MSAQPADYGGNVWGAPMVDPPRQKRPSSGGAKKAAATKSAEGVAAPAAMGDVSGLLGIFGGFMGGRGSGGGGGGGGGGPVEGGIIPWESGSGRMCDGMSFKNRGGSLGKKIRCGTVSLSDIPGQITYWISFVMKLIPSMGVVMVLIAGIYYLYGAVSDGEREKAKTALVSVAIGLVVAFCSWVIVDWIQSWLTAGSG